jgi:hypothetical protein
MNCNSNNGTSVAVSAPALFTLSLANLFSALETVSVPALRDGAHPLNGAEVHDPLS